jgi:hypothetical protein
MQATVEPSRQTMRWKWLSRLGTSDRSDMMEGLRRQLIGEAATASVHEALLVATMLFERAVWLIRDLHIPAHGMAPATSLNETAP